MVDTISETHSQVEDSIIEAAQRPPNEREPALHEIYERFGGRGGPYPKSLLRQMLAQVLRGMAASQSDGEVLQDKNYRQIARQMLDDIWAHEECYRLAYWQGIFYQWKEAHWEEYEPKELESQLYDWLDGRQIDTGEQVITCSPGQTMVTEVREALTSFVIRKHSGVVSWIGKPVARNILSCSNGLLDVKTGKLYPHTPRYFNLSSCAAPWEPEKVDFDNSSWMQFLNSVITDDRTQIDMLQEAMGYSLLSDTNQQKAFMLVGPRRCGKGTVTRVLSALVGGLLSSVPTSRFGSEFGLQNAIGKNIILLPDVRIDKNTKHGPLTETILSITGEDPQSISRKFKPDWNGILSNKIWAASNSIPKFRDEDGVLASRFLFVQFNVSFFGREDTSLYNRLLDELSLILAWAVKGWQRLHHRGYFDESPTSKALSVQAVARMDPVGTFVSETFEMVAEHSILKDHVWLSFFNFAHEHNMGSFTKAGFMRLLMGKDYAGVKASRVTSYDDAGKPAVDHEGNAVRIHVIKGIRFKEGLEPTREQLREWHDDYMATLPDDDAEQAEKVVEFKGKR